MGDDQDMKRCLAILLCLSFFLSTGQIAFSEGNGITGDFAAVGSVVTFGRYEQDNDLSNGPEPIEWTVLDVRDGKSLLISRFGLECRPLGSLHAQKLAQRNLFRECISCGRAVTDPDNERQRRGCKKPKIQRQAR